MKKRVSNWRLSTGGVTQCAKKHQPVERQPQPFALDHAAERDLAVMHVDAVARDPQLRIGVAQVGRPAALVPCQENAGFFEQLACRGDVVGNRQRPVDARQLSARMIDAVAPAIVRIVIRLIHAAAGKHVRAAHERRVLVPTDHEHFGAVRRVAQQDDRRRRARIDGERTARHRSILVCAGDQLVEMTRDVGSSSHIVRAVSSR